MRNLNHQYIAKLVVEAQKGSSNAFAELYAATYEKEYSYACRYLRDIHLAQDALQETYIAALKNIKTLKEPLSFVSWLNQITFHTCLNMSRHQKQLSDEYLASEEDFSSLSSPASTPEEQLIVVEHSQYIMDQVMSLPPLDAQAIILRYYKNLKIADISKMMRISKSTVKRHISSGLSQLKLLFSEYE